MYNDGDDGNAFLMGGEKVKSCSFKGPVGIIWEGEVLEEPKMVQQRGYDDDELLWWDKEETKPKMAAVIKLQTTVKDPADPEDLGVRGLWVKGESQKAVAQAVRAAGEKGIKVGGYLKIKFYAERDDTKPGEKPRFLTKLYQAHYTPPLSTGNQALMGPDDPSTWSAGPEPAQGPGDIRAAAAQQSALLAKMRNGQGQPQDQAPPF